MNKNEVILKMVASNEFSIEGIEKWVDFLESTKLSEVVCNTLTKLLLRGHLYLQTQEVDASFVGDVRAIDELEISDEAKDTLVYQVFAYGMSVETAKRIAKMLA